MKESVLMKQADNPPAPAGAEKLGAAHKPVYPAWFEDIEIPSYTEQLANTEDPLIKAIFDEL